LRGRIGWAMDKTLFYVTGGLAYGEVETTQRNLVGQPLTVTTSEVRYGYSIGGGVERAFTNNLTARLEYVFTDLGTTEIRDEVINRLDKSDVTVHAIRAGVSYKF
jgi:outer membrane immunogenic protein